MNCEECNFYTEEYSQDAKDNIPYCVKHKNILKRMMCVMILTMILVALIVQKDMKYIMK